jgi:hypothetical protein
MKTKTMTTRGPVFGIGSVDAFPSTSVGMNVPSSSSNPFVPTNPVLFSMEVGGPIPGHPQTSMFGSPTSLAQQNPGQQTA